MLTGCEISFSYHGFGRPARAKPRLLFSRDEESVSLVITAVDSEDFEPEAVGRFFHLCKQRLNLDVGVSLVNDRLKLSVLRMVVSTRQEDLETTSCHLSFAQK